MPTSGKSHHVGVVTSVAGRCHSGFVPARKCSGGTYLLADLFISASVDVPPLHERAHFWFDFKWFFRVLQKSMSSPINRQVFWYCLLTYPTMIRKFYKSHSVDNRYDIETADL